MKLTRRKFCFSVGGVAAGLNAPTKLLANQADSFTTTLVNEPSPQLKRASEYKFSYPPYDEAVILVTGVGKAGLLAQSHCQNMGISYVQFGKNGFRSDMSYYQPDLCVAVGNTQDLKSEELVLRQTGEDVLLLGLALDAQNAHDLVGHFLGKGGYDNVIALGSITEHPALPTTHSRVHAVLHSLFRLITESGFPAIDFADLRSVLHFDALSEARYVRGWGPNRYHNAVEKIFSSFGPALLSQRAEASYLISLLVHEEELSMAEFQLVNELIEERISENCDVILSSYPGIHSEPNTVDLFGIRTF